MKNLLFTLMLLLPAVAVGQNSYHIGNSLTNDSRPQYLPVSAWHIDGGRSLVDIFNLPDEGTNASYRWDVALAVETYDYLVLQPFPEEDTIEAAVEVISVWHSMQPQAAIVLHAGWWWPSQFVDIYETNDCLNTTQTCCPAYQQELKSQLEALGMTVRLTRSNDVLYDFSQDLPNVIGTELGDIYRDFAHMDYDRGRYLMFSMLRWSLGLEGFDRSQFPDTTLAEFEYLEGLAIDTVLGDCNRDGFVNLTDIEAFVDALSAGAHDLSADVNRDGVTNLSDVQPFIDLLN